MTVLTYVIALGLLSAAAAELLSYPPRIKNNTGCTEAERLVRDSSSCKLHCQVTSTVELNLNPIVTWAKQTSLDNKTNIYLPLSDGHWYDKLGFDFVNGVNYRCSLNVINITAHIYDCSYILRDCDHRSGQYQCTVRTSKKDSISMCAFTDDHGGNTGNRICFSPRPFQILATSSSKNESNVVDLSWSLDIAPPGIISCGELAFSVQVRSFATYSDFRIRAARNISGNIPVEKEVQHFTSTVEEDMYYVFDISVEFLDSFDKRNKQRVTSSPLFYFGTQEEPSITIPALDSVHLSAVAGGTVQLTCAATGIPSPEVQVYLGKLRIVSELDDPSIVQKTLVVNPDSVGEYYCTAVGIIVYPEGGARDISQHRTIYVEIAEGPSVHSDTENLVCASHGDTVCSKFILDNNVLVNASYDAIEEFAMETLTSLESIKMNADSSIPSYEIFSKCVELAKALVCHSVYPACDAATLDTRKICKNTCDLFASGGTCADVLDPQVFPDVSRLMLDNCDTRVNPAGTSPECVPIPLTTPGRSWCSRGDGQSYAGEIVRTTSGRVCQEWASQSPHPHHLDYASLLHLAERDCRNPGGMGERPWCYTVEEEQRWEYCDVPQCTVCEEYKGDFCDHLPGYKQQQHLIYVDRHESQWDEFGQLIAENWMLALYHRLISSGTELPDGCVEGLKELICHSTLPLCSSQATATPMPLCTGHCMLEDLLQVCPNDVLRKMKGEMEESGYTFSKPVCKEEQRSSDCLSVQTTMFSFAVAGITTTQVAENCYNVSDHGMSYAGQGSTTTSGATCQPWGENFPESKNYCRNPGHVGQSPWCFTDRAAGQWEYCDIQECGSADTPLPTTEDVNISSTTAGLIVFFAILGLFLIILSIILAVIMVLCIRRQKETPPAESPLSKLRNKQEWDYVLNETYCKVGGVPPKIQAAVKDFRQYDKSSIKYIRQLGQGNFGLVFYAKLEGEMEDEKETEVAVKTLKEEQCDEGLDDFVREAKLMFAFDHPNIVKILGVCIEEVPFYLIFEYMDKGDLAQFLRTSASSLQRRMFEDRPRSRTESTLSDEPPSLTVEQLTDICKQIAGGMKYLAEKNHVHRDLACRNCLVKSCNWEQTDSGLIIKIGDFGMSQNLYSSDYYRVRGQAVLPVRWMSPEAVVYGKFSTDSDVWSFGVVMWEVFSFAMQPYYGTSNEEVTQRIRRHKILTRPQECPNRLYEIMKSCWSVEPKLRPSFGELFKSLSNMRSSVSSSSNCDSGSELESDAFYEENSICEEDAIAA